MVCLSRVGKYMVISPYIHIQAKIYWYTLLLNSNWIFLFEGEMTSMAIPLSCHATSVGGCKPNPVSI